MRKIGIKTLVAVVATIAMLGMVACSEINEEDAPVELVATWVEVDPIFDLINPPEDLGEVELRAIVKREDPSSLRFLDVQLKSYRVTYLRTDGGKTVPQSFVSSTAGLIPAGGEPSGVTSFLVIEPGAFSQAPFAALYPENGGIDPETGQRTVKLDVILDFYGETISGENVSARTRAPFTFCVGCTL